MNVILIRLTSALELASNLMKLGLKRDVYRNLISYPEMAGAQRAQILAGNNVLPQIVPFDGNICVQVE